MITFISFGLISRTEVGSESTEVLIVTAEIEELASIFGRDSCELLAKAKSQSEEEQALKSCFSSLMRSPDDQIASALQRFEQRIRSLGEFFFHFAQVTVANCFN